MKTVSHQDIFGKRILLRIDSDVPLKEGIIQDDFRLKAGMETLLLCLENAKEITICGHLGRPEGEDHNLSIAPVSEWIKNYCIKKDFPKANLNVIENLRFEKGEDECDESFARDLASFGEVFINESFAAHHPSASVSLVPKIMPSFAGLRFAKEVETILSIKNSDQKPKIAIIGGAKQEDKYPAILELAKICDYILVGGLLPKEIKEENLEIPSNVILGSLNDTGFDLNEDSIKKFGELVNGASQIIWAGPVGKYEVENKGNLNLAKIVLTSSAKSLIGGGDTTAALNFYLDKFSFVSTGGGAMLDLLIKGTLPSIDAIS